MLGSQIIMAIKNLNTDIEKLKALFVFQWHKERGNNASNIHRKTIYIRNIRLLITLAATYEFEVRNQNVTQSYIQGDDVSQDEYINPTPEFQLPWIIISNFLTHSIAYRNLVTHSSTNIRTFYWGNY